MEKEHDLAKWLAGEMNETELRAFERSEGYETYRKIAEHTARLQAPTFDEERSLSAVLSRPKQKQRVRPLYAKLLPIAAVLVIGVGLWFAMQKEEPSVYLADAGAKTTFELPDASRVTLNAGSEASFIADDWDEQRKIQLKGEAFFHVAKGKKFTVITDNGKVTVLGTQFNVRSRGDRFEVECFEGKVAVTSAQNQAQLTKGQVVAFENGKAISVQARNGAQPGWMVGQLAFRAETLPQIASEIQRHFDVRIQLPAEVSDERFTGTMPGDDPLIALHVLARTYRLELKQTAPKTFILRTME